MATGRLYPAFFVIGGLLGAMAYMVTYVGVAATGILDDIMGGKATIGAIGGTKYPELLASVPGE